VCSSDLPSPQTASRPPATPRRRRGSWLWLVLVLIVAAAAGVGAYIVVRDQAASGGGGSGSGSGSSAPPASQASAVVTDFDPSGDGAENPAAVGNVVDGKLDTVWQTESYLNFAEKPGVGLRFDLVGTYSLASVKVITKQAGWSGAVYVSTKDTATLTSLADWGDPVATGSDLATSHTFSITPSRSSRSVLLWFTALPRGADGKDALAVAEVELA
jgi:hypothetical protein